MYFISNKNYNYSSDEVGSINYYAKKAYDDMTLVCCSLSVKTRGLF